ncbi:serine/threonine-protein kinase Chk2-like isoform X2 [Cylas formicarius]|uniref:serine/threonine-protein kinase Chk2-like isoform X2 n=1 Tax=Cylas formicarius TaxID=197179 RepID=UPI002958CB6A|nr:serine/threonine-protein kinase Chk2-like isoform X2 [Cylas formicarius]
MEEELALTLTPKEELRSSQHLQGTSIPWGRLITCKTYFESIDLVETTFSFGRADDCDVIVTSKMVNNHVLLNISKRHFLIQREDDGLVYITDQSKNGTFINGVLVGKGKTKILKSDDHISLAGGQNTFYVFLCKGPEGIQDFLPEALKVKYAYIKQLGRGSCGEVCLVKHRDTCEVFAIKKIVKSQRNTSQMHKINHPLKIANEINILRQISHPCIVGMQELLETESEVYLVLEYMAGGELTSKIINQNLTEANVKFHFYQMILAVQYLHLKGVTHRDLKPENILLLDDKPETILKVSDFGLSKVTDQDDMRTVCGTRRFVAPEVLHNAFRDYGEYGKEVDVWSLGVILFLMLSKQFPFESDDVDTLRQQILTGAYDMKGQNWAEISSEAKHLVRSMLTLHPKLRIKLKDIFKHPWISRSSFATFKFKEIGTAT